MAFDTDHTESLRATWLWRNAPAVLIAAAVAWLIGGEATDWFRARSLRTAKCTIVSARVDGEYQVTTRRRFRSTAQYVEQTNLEVLVDGAEPRRRLAAPGRGYEVGQVRACWASGDDVYLNAPLAQLEDRVSRVTTTAVLALVGGGWMWSRRRGLATDRDKA